MEYFDQILEGPAKYVLIFMVAVVIIYIPIMIVYMKKKKKKATDYLSLHPEAAHVFIIHRKKGFVSDHLAIHTVNDGYPETFIKEGKNGFFLLPGKNKLEVSYSWTRPGVLYKNVTTEVPVSIQTVTVEPGKSYEISYDTKEETYCFEERA